MNCYVCDSETEFVCDRCGQPICDDCCTPMTIHNQIDYPLCNHCYETQESERWEYNRKIDEEKEIRETERKERNRKRRENYHKPQNIEKRRIKKEEQKQRQKELLLKECDELVKMFKDLFGGM